MTNDKGKYITRFKILLLILAISVSIMSLTDNAIAISINMQQQSVQQQESNIQQHILTTENGNLNTFIILNSANISDMLENIRYIESYGVKATHRFPPNIIIGEIPENNISKLKHEGHIVRIETIVSPTLPTYTPSTPSSVYSAIAIDTISVGNQYGKTAEVAAFIWNENYVNAVNKPKLAPSVNETYKVDGKNMTTTDIMKKLSKSLDNDIMIYQISQKNGPMSTIQNKSSGHKPYGADFYDTSEYMIGNIAVGLIFPESNGNVDPNIESWSWNEMFSQIGNVQKGLNWLATRDSRAKLTYTYDIHFQIPTRYEPVSHFPNDDYLWITDIMNYMGYKKYDWWTNVKDYDNNIRDLYKTDWAYTTFVFKSKSCLFCSLAGHAYLGGPYAVIRDGFDFLDTIPFVVAHETLHIFYATDEYNGKQEYSGYLNTLDNEGSWCLMDNTFLQGLVPILSTMCTSSGTRLQLGWRDSNNNGIFDIIDFNPTIKLFNKYNGGILHNNIIKYRGTVSTTDTYPNNNPHYYYARHDITINNIDNVKYSVDPITIWGNLIGIWNTTTPTDGSFDSAIENFTFTTSALTNGNHVIYVKSQNALDKDFVIISKDIIAPTTTIHGVTEGGIYNNIVTITLTAADNQGGSGVNRIDYNIIRCGIPTDISPLGPSSSGGCIGSRHSAYTTPFIVSGIGSYNITFWSTDNAGNIEPYKTVKFSIISSPDKKTISITSPRTGDIWQAGSKQTIRWDYTGDVGTSVNIELYKGTEWIKQIKKNIQIGNGNIGTTIWTMDKNRPSGNDYWLNITSNSGIIGKSGYFTIIGSQPITSLRADRTIDNNIIIAGSKTRITIVIQNDDIQRSLSLQEIIPTGWIFTKISDDATQFKASTNEWAWLTIENNTAKTVIYQVTVPSNTASGTYNINGYITTNGNTINVTGDNTISITVVPPVSAKRTVDKHTLTAGSETSINIDIHNDNTERSLSLQERIPPGWILTKIYDDATNFKASTNEWVWLKIPSNAIKTVKYKLTVPSGIKYGKYNINGNIVTTGNIISVTGDDTISVIKGDILSYYRLLGKFPNIVETNDLLQAADDWRNDIIPSGYSAPITTSQLLILADEWRNS